MPEELKPLQMDYDEWVRRSGVVWDERAAGWDAMLDDNPDERERELDRAAAALRVAPGSRLLDAGCGTGQWAVGFALRGARVAAIDVATQMLDRARENARQAGADIDLRAGDIGALTDPDDSFDAIHCRCVLQFSPDPARALRGFARVIRPGGRLFVSVPGALSPIYGNAWRRFVDPGLITNAMLPWELDRLLEELGWRILDGWGQWTRAGNGGQPCLVPEQAATLPGDLQRATCTFWTTIAEPA